MPSVAEAYQVALSLHRKGNVDLAEQIYRSILEAEPRHAQSWHMLGVAAVQRNDHRRGVEFIERAIALDSRRAAFHSNLGAAYRELGRLDEAEISLRRALDLSPRFANALCNLGLTLADKSRCDEAVESLQLAAAIQPEDPVAAVGLAYALGETGRPGEALQVLRQAIRANPAPQLRLMEATMLPLVYGSVDEIAAWRAHLETHVERLAADGLRFDLAGQTASPVFSLAYQAMNDRVVQQKIAALYHVSDEAPLARAARADGRIHVGFISSHFNRHTVGKLQRGMIAELSRAEFFVTVLSIGREWDEVSDFIFSRADQYVELPRSPAEARQVVRRAGLDILYYCDIGMDAMTYSLAFSRLAPVQCVTWGHPSTTGIATIDYFVSSGLMEPPDADEHYTEKLVRLDSLSVHYYRPQAPREADRGAFGLDRSANLYVCPQSIYKFHPEFDALLGGILRRDPQGRAVLIRWAYEHPDELLRHRFARTMPDVAERIDFIPRLQQEEFHALLTVADVLLDPLHFGGGHTSLDALAFGTPVVTLPGRYLRGRITLGLYRQMGVMECVAQSPEEYVAIAVRLGTDRNYRAEVQTRIREFNNRLYEDRDSVRQLEAFFRQVCPRRAGAGERS